LRINIWLRDRIKIHFEQNNKEGIVTIELPEIPETFRYRDISLAVETSSKFEIESNSNNVSISSDGKSNHKLINLRLK
jgi:hypothetical protein